MLDIGLFPSSSRAPLLGLVLGLTFTSLAAAQTAPPGNAAPAAPTTPAAPAPTPRATSAAPAPATPPQTTAPATSPTAPATSPTAPSGTAPAASPGSAPAVVKAPAKPPTKKERDTARKSFSDGEKAFAKADYVAAEAAFAKANSLVPSPHAEYWIAKSLDLQNLTQEAIRAYETFVANPEASNAGEDKVSDAKARLEELKLRTIAVIELTTVPPGAVVMVDGAAQPPATPIVLKLTPGMHRLSVSAPGYEPKELDIDAQAGMKQAQTIELSLVPPPPPPPPPAPTPVTTPPPAPPAERSMVPAYVTLGIAGAGAVVGTIFGLQALSAKNDFDDTPTRELADDTERNALIADMAFGVAVTLGVTGIVLLTTDDEVPAETATKTKAKTPRRAKLELLPYGGPKSGGATARFAF